MNPNLLSTTKRYDEQTGLIHYQYRPYGPAIGRWLTRDPLGEAGGINLYAFVGNNPVNWVDPYGLAPLVNKSKIPIKYKPEDESNILKCCPPGETCDIDGVYPPNPKKPPIKIPDNCRATVDSDGKLKVKCILPGILKKKPQELDDKFFDDHPDWPKPDEDRSCPSDQPKPDKNKNQTKMENCN